METGRIDELSKTWIDGWESACQRIRGILSESTLKVNDSEARAVLDGIFNQVSSLEKKAFHEMPTLISHNPSKPPED